MLAGLLLALVTALATAAGTEGSEIPVYGSVYRDCTVNTPENGIFHLGTFTVAHWVTNQSWLSHGAAPVFTFTLTGCDEGTHVTISATGTPVDSGERASWLANQQGTSQELAASLELIGADGTGTPLRLNDGQYSYGTVTETTPPTEVKLKGLLQRTDNSHTPVGTFRAQLTVYFDFS
jgi:hypothetical protein